MVNEFPFGTGPIGKTGLPFQNFRLSQEVSSGTSQKIVYHLHPSRYFRELVVNGKQPLRSAVLSCVPLCSRVTLCYPVLPCFTLCSPVFPCITPCYPVLPCATLCYPVLLCVTPGVTLCLCVLPFDT